MEVLLAKYFSGECSDEERLEVLDWRSQNEENSREFLEFKEVWLATSALSEVVIPELETDNYEGNGKVIGWPNYLKYAAAVLLFALIGSLWYFNGNADEIITDDVFYGSAELLEDGSTVSIQDGSSLTVMEFDEEKREVRIEGKAFFDITHDPGRPFFVRTEDAIVQVLGTSFMVSSSEGFTEVMVESGIVRLSASADDQDLFMDLTAGERGLLGESMQGMIKTSIDDTNFLSWKDGVMIYDNTPISDVISTMEDTYGVDIQISDELANCRLTAKFEKKSLQDAIKYLAATFAWEYDIKQDLVVLSGEGC